MQALAGIPYPQHVVWRQRAGDLATCQNSHSGKPKEPRSSPFTPPFSPAHVLGWYFMKRMIPQHEIVLQYSYCIFASPRSDRPGLTAAGRSCWPSSLWVRSNRALSFTTLGSASGLLLVPCGHYIAASERSPSPGVSIHVREHKAQTLSQQSGLSQGRYRTGPRNRHANVI